MSDDKSRRNAEHIWHVWLNRWNQVGDSDFDHSMYEFKSMLDFLRYGHQLIEQAFTGNLRTIHRQCSLTAPEHIESNCLKCAFGKDVTECGILKSLKSTFDEKTANEHYADAKPELFRIMANTCAWHMYTEPIRTGQFLDTTEGWLMDKSDRMFWDNVYSILAQSDEKEAPHERD